MKRQTTLALAILATLAIFAAPKFITPSMMRRNGLTDEQYEFLWSIGRNPTVDTATARDWVFRASRYHNVTNWLGIMGATNDFAALATHLHRQNIVLSEANKDLGELAEDALKDARAFSNAWLIADMEWRFAQSAYEAATNREAIATARAERVSAALDERRAEYVQKRDAAALLTTKAIYQAFIDAIDRIKEKIDGE